MIKTILPGERSGTVFIPASKSMAHRALICAALSSGPSGQEADRQQAAEGRTKTEKKPPTIVIGCPGISADIEATAACLNSLGAQIRIADGQIEVMPVRKVPPQMTVLPCGESGSTLRFLLPVAGALGADAVFEMEGRLPQRPMQEYEQLLREHGMMIRREENRLYCSGRLKPGTYALPGNISSQYFSGLLFALPLLDQDSILQVQGSLESADYVTMTKEMLKASGIRTERCPEGDLIFGNQSYHPPLHMQVEGDYSNAAFFLCIGALSEQGVTVRNLNPDSVQGDRRILELLTQFGAGVSVKEGEVTVRKGELKGMTIDASMIPDLIPVLSVLAAYAQGETRIEHAQRLRMKESDRLLSTLRLLQVLRAEVTELEDGLLIRGKPYLTGGGLVDSFSDHRIAMAAAVGSCGCLERNQVLQAECVAKSYPEFWKDFESLEVTA